jgi:poly-gamma-glutamate synthesis protein (capsule biosynthesis protein)
MGYLSRRQFLISVGGIVTALPDPVQNTNQTARKLSKDSSLITLFLCGDVMTGRGIDQVLPQPSDPRLYEPSVKTAVRYVELAEKVNGPIPKPVDFSYIWGDALRELEQVQPAVRIINLETAVTESDDYWRGKGINYRMHPQNASCITAAKIDCCVLSNNHVLDWGYSGLEETLATLRRVGVKTAGAGRSIGEAEEPAVIQVPSRGRVIVFAFGSETSGIPSNWAATANRGGVNLLKNWSDQTVAAIAAAVKTVKRKGDIVVASIHWGGNWGYEISRKQRDFAHKLIDKARVDVIHGHSSHHPMGIEVYGDKPIMYGCGDFLSDYEGIPGYEEFRADLVLMYFVTMDRLAGTLTHFAMTPLQIKRFRLQRVSTQDAKWLQATLSREGKKLGSRVELDPDGSLMLRWNRRVDQSDGNDQ